MLHNTCMPEPQHLGLQYLIHMHYEAQVTRLIQAITYKLLHRFHMRNCRHVSQKRCVTFLFYQHLSIYFEDICLNIIQESVVCILYQWLHLWYIFISCFLFSFQGRQFSKLKTIFQSNLSTKNNDQQLNMLPFGLSFSFPKFKLDSELRHLNFLS